MMICKIKIIMMSFKVDWLVLAVLVTVHCKIVQVPSIAPEETLYLRMDQLLSLEDSFATFGELQHMHKKEVYELKDGKEASFQPCYEQAPSSRFLISSEHRIRGNVAHSGLVYDFEDVKYPNNLIDIALHKDHMYYMLGTGAMHIDFIRDNFGSIEKGKEYQLLNQDKVANGYFAILPEAISGKGIALFVNGKGIAAVDLNGENFEQVVSEDGPGQFQSAIALEGNYFAAAYSIGGVKIYSINNDRKVKVEAELNKTSQGLSQCDITDIAYDKIRKILFVLNRPTGVLSLQLTFIPQLSLKVTSSVISSPNCDVIYYDSHQEELYLSCNELHKYRISKWPVIAEKVLPKQDIAIRQITSTEEVVAFVGRNIFELVVADRKTSVYRDRLLDKLILTETEFISANENAILIGHYTLNPPQLFCSTRNNSYLGTHRLVLKTTASCNPKFFAETGFEPGVIDPEDKCVYTVYQNMEVWEAAEIDAKPFLIFSILIGLLGLVIIIWWGCSHLSLHKLRNFVDNYRELEEDGVGTEQDRGRSPKEEGSKSSGETGDYKPHVDEADIPDAGLHDIE